MADQQQAGAPQLPGLTPSELEILKKVFSSPLDVPQEFRSWLISYIEANPPETPFSQVFGAQAYIDSNIANIQAHAPEVVTSLPASPTDGKMVLLKTGTTYVLLSFDATASMWVSPEFSGGGGTGSTTSLTLTPVAGAVGISWVPVHIGGLTMQLRWGGSLSNNGGGGANQGLAEVVVNFSNLTSGYTNSNMMSQSVPGDSVVHPVGVDWTNVTDPGDYVVASIGLELTSQAGTTTVTGSIVGRYIKSV